MPRLDSSLQRRLKAIKTGPQGAHVAVFFDLDGTLIDGFSAMAWLRDRIRKRQLGLREFSEILTFALSRTTNATDFDEIMEGAAHRCRGMTETAFAELWQKLFKKELSRTLYPEAWELVQAHHHAGHTLAIASSATRYQVQPFADELEIENLLCSELEVRNGVFTGVMAHPPLWRERKAAAVVQFGADHATDPRLSYAYSNGAEDIPFLEAVGKPMALNPEPALAATARQRGWPQTRFRPRRKAPTGDRFRTVLAYSTMATSALGGLLLNAAGSPRREAVNVIMGTATDAGLAAAGIKLHILGEENLWAQRPAVFIINHQSKLDFLLGVNLIRRDTTGVAKKEARNVPGFGQFMQYAGMAFVDRANSKAAREAMKPAVDKLKAGMSLGIAPEGTRSYSPRLGPFKKGAFHLARQGGVPIVPIVFRNAWECMHRNDQWFHPGTVDVAVLPPIDISGWKVAEFEHRIADVRQLYLDLLADWPQSRAEFDDRFGAAA